MKRIPRQVLMYVLYAIIIAFAALSLHTCNVQSKAKDLRTTISGKNAREKVLLRRWVDSEGRSRARAGVVEAEKESIKLVYEDEINILLEQVKGLKSNLRNLNSATTVATATSGTVEVVVRDTVYVDAPEGAKVFNFEDPYLYLDGELSTISNKLSITYRITNNIRLIEYRKKSGFLGFKKETVVEAISDNPNTTITGLTELKIKPTHKRIGLVLYAGYGVSKDGLGPNIGIGIGYRPFR